MKVEGKKKRKEGRKKRKRKEKKEGVQTDGQASRLLP